MNSPIPPGDSNKRQAWKDALAAGPACLAPERLAESDLDSAALAHVEGCPHCQAERALWMAFENAEPSAGEGAAVEWIARETRRRVFPVVEEAAPTTRAAGRRFPRWATSMAAALAVAAGVFLLVRPAPTIDVVDPGTVYRTNAVEVVAPSGDLLSPPTELRWQPVNGAVRYDVTVNEVDGTEIWRTTTAASRVTLPDVVRGAARPARTLTWRVTAVDASGRMVAEPGTASFRVAIGALGR